MREGQGVQHGVRAATHSHVEGEGIVNSLDGDEFSWGKIQVEQLQDLPGSLAASASRSGLKASAVPLKGSARPRASIRQFIELAVNRPEQEPQVGQA